MSYVAKTLARGEEVIFRANFNWTYSLFPTVWFSIGMASLAMLALIQFAAGFSFEGNYVVAWWSAGIGAAAGTLILLTHLVILMTTEIVVTTYRFVYKVGLIARKTQEVSLNNIEEITLEETILGRFFGFGKLTMRGTGVGVIILPSIDNPIRVRKHIENARAALRQARKAPIVSDDKED